MTTTTDAGTDSPGSSAGPDSRVLIGLNHGDDEPENVLIAYLMGVEALRAGKEVVLWLTRDGVKIAVQGQAEKIEVPGAPAVGDLHAEYVERGGRFFACPVCVRTRGLEEATWTGNVQVAGAPAVYEYTSGGALVFNY